MSDLILYTLIVFAFGFACGAKFGTPSEMYSNLKEKVSNLFNK